MPFPLMFSNRLRRASVVAGASAAFTLLAAPAMAEEADYEIERTHTVEAGESLSAIADNHDLDSWVVLYAVNADDIDQPDVLLIDQEVDIPADPDAVDVDAIELPGASSAEPDTGTSSGTASEPGSAASTASAEPAPEPEPEPEHTHEQPAQSAAGGVWDRLAQCESNGDWFINTGNGFHGGLQFHPQTWSAHGGEQFAPTAAQASREQEIAVAERVLASQGWGAWPACASKLGLR